MKRKYLSLKLYTINLFCLKACLLLIFILAPFKISYSAELFDLALPQNTNADWEISSNSLSSLDNGAIIEARGDVIVQRGEDILQADFARYYTATGWIFVQGNVLVKLGRDSLSASEAEINLHDLTGFLRNGTVLMESSHIYFSGEFVKKHFGDKYSFTNASITTCDPNSPFWQVNAGSAVIDLDGSATLSATSIDVAFLSTPNVPYASFSFDRSRESGFLLPRLNYTSLLGFYTTIPFFWDISDSRDLSFNASYFQFTGSMASINYRAYTDIDSKTWLALDYLFSNASFDKQNVSEVNRYWLRGMQNGTIFDSDWYYKLNVDYVSDSSFLQDYKSSYLGYTNTISETYNFFGRDLAQIYKDRVTEGYIYRHWKNTMFSIGFQYNQNPLYGDTYAYSEDTTVQKPFETSAYMFPVNFSPFMQVDAMGQLAYYFRQSGISGAKANFQPKLSAPLNLGIISVLPQLTLVQRNYFASTEELIDAPLADPTISNKIGNSTLFNFNISSMLQASRIWQLNVDNPLTPSAENIGKSQKTALQHLLEPSLSYSYTPYSDQDSLPYYSQEDRLLEQSEISLSIRNAVVAKKESVIPKQNNSNNNEADIRTSFESVFNFSVLAGYNFEEERRTKYLDEYPKKPFSDIKITSQFYPFNMSFSLLSTISLYGDGITRFDLSTKIPLFALERYISWSTAISYRNTMYDYQNIIQYATSENISLSKEVALLRNYFELRPFDSIKINLDLYRDLNTLDSYEIGSALTYYHECFELALRYSYSPYEQSAGLMIAIPGIF